MEIIIGNKTLQYENNRNDIEKVLKEIEKKINKTSKILHSMIIDDVQIYEEYFQYFYDNIKQIENVEVVLTTHNNLLKNILDSAVDYLAGTPTKIEKLAGNFYSNPDNQDWKDLTDLFEAITWLYEVKVSVNSDVNFNNLVEKNGSWVLYTNEIVSLSEFFPVLESALQAEDHVTVGDILSYEIAPRFEVIAEALSLVNKELERK